MPYRSNSAVATLFVCLLGVRLASAEDVNDVIFATRYDGSPAPKSADFYFNGRAIGTGRKAFATIVDKIRQLPEKSSVVWGPNYRRCGACSGSEPPCVAKYLYPDLWRELEAQVKTRRLFLSSDYPGPWPTAIPGDHRGDMPMAIDASDPVAEGRFDATLVWQVVDYERKPKEPIQYFVRSSYRHIWNVSVAY